MLGIRKIYFFIALTFSIYIKYLDLLFWNKFTTILLVLPLNWTILLSLILNVFKTKLEDLVIFNNKISSVAILLKP